MEFLTLPPASVNEDQAVPRIGADAPAIAALVLAAGRSSRMGQRNKLLIPLDGVPMIVRSVETALTSGARPVVVVTGHDAAAVTAALKQAFPGQIRCHGDYAEMACPAASGGDSSDPVSLRSPAPETPAPETPAPETPLWLVDNPGFAAGMSGSLRTGLAALPATVAGALICLGDMPYIAPPTLEKLIAAFEAETDAENGSIIVPVASGRRGHPVLWSRSFFAAIQTLTGDTGARKLLMDYSHKIRCIPVDDPGIFLDCDTPDSIEARIGHHAGSAVRK